MKKRLMPPGKAHFWGTLILLGLLSTPVFAQEPGQAGDKSEDTEMPSLEFLEFLGDWETDDGEWIDPEELEKIVLTDQEQEKNEDEQPE